MKNTMLLLYSAIVCMTLNHFKVIAATSIKDDTVNDNDNSYYIFLQKFPLQHTFQTIFHTEVLVCPRNNFSSIDQTTLDERISSMQDFVEIETPWWENKSSTNCVQLGYGGAACTDACCSVPFTNIQTSYPLNEKRAIIPNADVEHKTLFLYGNGAFDGVTAHAALCNQKCWSAWSGTDYNPITNNCNTFTSTVLSCVYGLSQKKPNLGPSDMITVECSCAPKQY